MTYPSYPPDLTSTQLEQLTTAVKDWSIAHGLAVRPAPSVVPVDRDAGGSLALSAPVTLFPSLFPRKRFTEAVELQESYNELYAAIARDEEWLGGVVTGLLEIDDFIANLWEVHLTVKKEGYVQDLSLGLFRSDYMVHSDPTQENAALRIRQVEFNTIASSFGGLSSRVTSLHQYLLAADAYPVEAAQVIKPDSLVENLSVQSLARGLAQAHRAYGASRSGKPLCVLIVVQSPERNVFDQRHLEYELLSSFGIHIFRLPFATTLHSTEVLPDRTLTYAPPGFPNRTYEVTTIYFRAGYSPDDYSGPESWQARLQLERSAAIKCPSILTHLAGSKKVQQMLATPGSPDLLRFAPSKEAAERLLKTFSPIYPMDTSKAGQEARQLALDPETASRYVLKPQREGGGNNIYRKAIPEFLKKTPESHWPAYILMEMMEPPTQSNYVYREGQAQHGGVICELGVFGTCLWRQDGEILHNASAGHLLRTKGDQSEEGGVAAGFGAIDSVCLIDI